MRWSASGGYENRFVLYGSGRRRRAAALDVVPQESLIGEEAAIFHEGAARDGEDFKVLVIEAALRRIIATTLANVEAFAQGTPQNVVSPR